MFDIGFSELALIAILALLIAGPERLPGIMRGLGRLAGHARSVYAAMRTELEREVEKAKSEPQSQNEDDSTADRQADEEVQEEKGDGDKP